LIQILALCYRLLKHILANQYELNEFYISQWIELFFDQSMNSRKENNICVEGTITALIGYNKNLLEKQITKETIDNFINLVKSQAKHE
jgi:hypothetical protein